jgi:hypothetical protein
MEKTCPKHGHFEDVIAIDPKFLARIESLFPGATCAMTPDKIHDHGSSPSATAAAPCSRSTSPTAAT